MATWTVQFDADPELSGAANSNLTGIASLDESSKPGDFDSGATVNSVRIVFRVTGSGFSDDTWDIGTSAVQLRDSTGGALASITPASDTGNGNETHAVDLTDSSPSSSGANYLGALTLEASGGGSRTWATYVSNMKSDGGSMVLEGGAAESFVVIDYTAGVAGQNLTGSAAFTPTLSFPQGSVDLTVIGPAAFTPTLSFPAGTALQEQFLTGGGAFGPTLSFPAGTVSQLDYRVFRRTPPTGAAFTPGTDSFIDETDAVTYADNDLASLEYEYQVFNWTGTAWSSGSAIVSIVVPIFGSAAFTPTLTFPQGTLSQSAGGQNLDGSAAFTPTLTFGAGTLIQEQFVTGGAAFTPTLTFPTGSVDLTVLGATFAPALSFPTGELKETQLVTGGATFAPTLTFPQGSVDLTVLGATFTPALTFPTGTALQEQFLTGGAAFTPTLSFPTGQLTQDGGPQTLLGTATFAPTLTFPQGSVDLTVLGATFTPTLSFPQGSAIQQQFVTGGAAFTPTLTFPTGNLSQAGGPQTLVGAVVTPSLTFGAGSVDLTVLGATFAPALSFPTGRLDLTLLGATFAPTLTFGAGTLIQQQFLVGAAAFTPTLTFPTGDADLPALTFWTTDAVDVTRTPVAYTENKPGFTRVGPNDPPPW